MPVKKKKEVTKLKVSIKKEETLVDKLNARKKVVREKFLEIVKIHNPKTKFNSNTYIRGSGGQGILKEALGEFNKYDRSLFVEVLHDLVKEKILYHIGGSMYVLERK